MRSTRRYFSLILALVMILTLCMPWAGALAATDAITLTINAPAQAVAGGGTFTVTITTSQIEHPSTIGCRLMFDPTKFECTAVQKNVATYLENSGYSPDISSTNKDNTVGFAAIAVVSNSDNYSAVIPADTILMTVTLKAKAGITNGSSDFTISQTGSNTQIYVYASETAQSGTIVPLTISPATITVTGGVNPALTGSLSVTGSPIFGQTLTASPSSIPADAALSYQWYRGATAISGATGSTYELTQADIGSSIKVSATATGYSGSIESAATAAVAKAAQNAPARPTLASKTDTSVTLNTIANAVYAMSSGSSAPSDGWRASPAFSGLTANTNYYFFAKYPGTDIQLESAASDALAITTNKAAHTVTVITAPASGAGTASADAADATEGTTVHISATPAGDYYFSDWTTSDDVTFGDENATSTSFEMPDRAVTVTANFAEKESTSIALSNKTTDYTGSAIAIGAPTLTNLVPGDVTITYAKQSGGTPTATAPSDVGTYTVTASFAGDETRKATSATATLTISMVPQAIPAAPAVTAHDAASITVSVIAGQKYLLQLTSAAIPDPADTDAGWITPSADGSYTWNNLQPGTSYTAYTFKMPDNNHTASALASIEQRTAHTWSLTVKEGGSAVSALNFFARTNYTSAPATKTITLTNASSGALKNVSVALTGTNAADYFTLSTTGTAATLNPASATSFTVAPKANLPKGTYTAAVAIGADKDDPSETGALAQQTINLTFAVADKVTVTIGGLSDISATYNGAAQGADASALTTSVPAGETAYSGSLTVWYEGTGTTSYTKSITQPADAGTYQITAEVPSNNMDYMGSATATLTIAPKELTVTGLSVTSRTYDGTADAALTGGTLSGVVTGDSVSISGGIPTAGTFSNKNAGTGKPVNIAALTLAGADQANYTLTQPVLTGTITAKAVKPIVTVSNRDYDGTAVIGSTLISASFGTGAILGSDSVTVSYGASTVADKNAGANKLVTLGAVTVSGNADNNYQVQPADAPTVTITPYAVDVTVTGTTPVTYDGGAKALTAAYTPLAGDTANVTVLYNGSAAAPILAGNYAITAQINDPNYSINNMAGVAQLVINKGILSHTDINRSVAFEDTRDKTVSVADFAPTAPAGSAAPTGTWALGTVTDTDGILSGVTTLSNGTVTFKIKAAAAIGQSATIHSVYTPAANTYEAVTASINVTVGQEGYTNTVVGAPATVKLGEDIALTGMALHTVFESGKPAEDVPITTAMLSGYNKGATGAESIGQKTVTVTHPENTNRIAAFTITVQDVLTGFSVTPPSKLTYDWNAPALDLAGGSVKPIMRSAIEQTAVPITQSLISVTNAILGKLGTYPVNVAYGGITNFSAFSITVRQEPAAITGSPAANQPGVVSLPNDVTFQTSGGTAVAASDVRLTVEPVSSADSAALLAAAASQSSFTNVPAANILALDISLEQVGTGAPVQPSGKITIRIPYPAGTDSLDTFTILHKKSDGSVAVYTPAKTANGLEFEVESFSPFAIGWIDYAAPSGGGGWYGGGGSAGLSTQVRMNIFWEQVRSSIASAVKGSVIRASAGDYDQMPVSVMNALRSAPAVTLVIQWNGGADIVITSAAALTPETTREYYPLEYLAAQLAIKPPKTDDPAEGEAWLAAQRAAVLKPVSEAIASGVGAVVDIIAPQVAEDTRTTYTPASAGLFGPVAPANVQSAAIEIVQSTEAAASGMPVWAIVLIGAAVLGGAAILVLNRRKLFHKV